MHQEYEVWCLLDKVVFSLKLVCSSSCVHSLLSDAYDDLALFFILNAMYITAAKINMTTTDIPRASATDELEPETWTKWSKLKIHAKLPWQAIDSLIKNREPVFDVDLSYLQMSEFPASIGEAIPRK